jgi:hypothetical protein
MFRARAGGTPETIPKPVRNFRPSLAGRKFRNHLPNPALETPG